MTKKATECLGYYTGDNHYHQPPTPAMDAYLSVASLC